MDSTWIQERIDATKTAIVAYEDAIQALSTGAQSYRLMTGQTDMQATKSSLASLRETLSMLENRLATYEARLCGAALIGRPAF